MRSRPLVPNRRAFNTAQLHSHFPTFWSKTNNNQRSPSALNQDDEAFSYRGTNPLSAGTEFQLAAGDSQGGGTSGSSSVFTMKSSVNNSCLDQGFVLEG